MKRMKTRGLAWLTVLALVVCACLPGIAVFADEKGTPAVYADSLTAGGVYDVKAISFLVQNAVGETITVTVNGSNAVVQRGDDTRRAGVNVTAVTADATAAVDVLGDAALTVTVGETVIFQNTVTLEAFGVAETQGQQKFTNGTVTVTDGVANITDATGNPWTAVGPFRAADSMPDARPGRYEFSFDMKDDGENDNGNIAFQIFRKSTSSAVWNSLLLNQKWSDSDIGGVVEREKHKWYHIHIRLDLDHHFYTAVITPEGGDSITIVRVFTQPINGAMLTDADVRGFRLLVQPDQDAEENKGTATDISIKNVTYHNMRRLSGVASVTADGAAVAATDGVYAVSPGVSQIQVKLDNAILSTDGISFSSGASTEVAGDTITITPEAALTPNADYTLTIPKTVTDPNGTALGAARAVRFHVSDFGVSTPAEGEVLNMEALPTLAGYAAGAEAVKVRLNGAEVSLTGTESWAFDAAGLAQLGSNMLEVYATYPDGGVKTLYRTFAVIKSAKYEEQKNDYNGKYNTNSVYGAFNINNTQWTIQQTEDGDGASGQSGDKALRYDNAKANDRIQIFWQTLRRSSIASGKIVLGFDMKATKPDILRADVCGPNGTSCPTMQLFNTNTDKLIINGGKIYGAEKTETLDDKWHTYRMVLDFDAQTTNLYLDGNPLGEMNNTKGEVKTYFDSYASWAGHDDTSYYTDNTMLRFYNATADSASLYFDNLEFYFEVPDTVAAVSYGDGETSLDETMVVPEGTTEFYLTTPLNIPEEEVTADKVKLLDETGADQTVSVEKVNHTGEGTKIKLTANPLPSGTRGMLSLAAELQYLATDIKTTHPDLALTKQESHMVSLGDALKIPVRFAKDGLWAEKLVCGGVGIVDIVNAGTDSANLLFMGADYGADETLKNAKVNTLSIAAGERSVGSFRPNANANQSKAYLWEADTLKPLLGIIDLK